MGRPFLRRFGLGVRGGLGTPRAAQGDDAACDGEYRRKEGDVAPDAVGQDQPRQDRQQRENKDHS